MVAFRFCLPFRTNDSPQQVEPCFADLKRVRCLNLFSFVEVIGGVAVLIGGRI